MELNNLHNSNIFSTFIGADRMELLPIRQGYPDIPSASIFNCQGNILIQDKMKRLSFEELPKLNSERWLSIEDLQGENWKDVVGYEGVYYVSDYGRVKGMPNRLCKQVHILKTCFTHNGYCTISLKENNNSMPKRVHRLVCIAFLANPNNYPQINHKDENKLNNTLDNLEWCTSKYNCNYGTRNERTTKYLIEKGATRKVNKYTKDGKFISSFQTLAEAALDCGSLSAGTIWACCTYRTYSFHGYTYRFADDTNPTFRRTMRTNVKIELYKNGDVLHTFDGYKDFASFCNLTENRVMAIRKGENIRAIKGYDVVVTKRFRGSTKILYSSFDKKESNH